jgi:uncharacterized protein YfaS (alpha-2-macroglobulin family)
MKVSSKRIIVPMLAAALILIGLIAMACNLPAGLQERISGQVQTNTPTPAPTNTPQPLPPTIVETDPIPGSTISLEGSLTVYFNQAMDQASVESAFNKNLFYDGTISWTDLSTMIFSPTKPLPSGEKIIFSLDTAVLAANGLPLDDQVDLEYFTPDLLRATTFLPLPDSIEIDPASSIVVTFNQPVVQLGETQTQGPEGLIITPKITGNGEWINTSTYQFTPTDGLAGGTTYQVELPENLVSISGSTLDPAATSSWSFSTSYPQVLSWTPGDGDLSVALDTSIQIVFNQAMNPTSLETNFQLINENGEQVRGSFEWSENYQEAIFVPETLFERGSRYSAILPGETSSAGNSPLNLETVWGFATADEFRFLGTPEGQNYRPSIYEGVTLYFNNPVDEDTVIDGISIFPEVDNLSTSTGGAGNILNLYGDFQPLTEYSLVISDTLADVWGSQLGTLRSLKFSTRALPANLVVTQGTSLLYLTGSENVIPVQATNLYQVSINVGTIPEEMYPNFFGSGIYKTLDEYYPADVRYWDQVLSVPGDDSYTVNLPLNRNGTNLVPGLYRYQIYSQELSYNPSPYLLAVSNKHLTMKTSPENLLIWGIDLESGDPLSNTSITIYNDTGAVLFEGETNEEGIFQADFLEPQDLYDTVFYAIAGEPGNENFGVTASNWAFGTEPYNFGLASNYGAPQPLTYIYTDRPIYRPGQTVHFRLIHRNRARGEYVLPTEESIQVKLFKGGEAAEELELPLSEYGTAHGEFRLSNQAIPGYYRLETEDGMVLFQVAEYRKPEINLTLEMNEQESMLGEEWGAGLDARYYFDAPAADADLSWSVRAERTAFYLPGYQVGELQNDWFVYPGYYYPFTWSTLVNSGEGKTDADGKWEIQDKLINVDYYDKEILLPANYLLSVTIEDETGFQVSTQKEVLVHPSDFYIGVKPSAWIAESDQEVEFDILTVDWNKVQDGIHDLKAEFKRVTWNHQIGEIGQVEYTKETELIAEESFKTNQRGEAAISFTPPSPGTYQVDVFGGGARTEATLWVGGPGAGIWPTQSNQKINIVADQEAYLPGDEATIFIPNPFPEGAEALLTIERHKVIDHQTISISSSGEEITIPLENEDAPNVYVSVILLGKSQDGRADFRQGYVNLIVEPLNQLLNVEVLGEPERLGPGEEVEFNIRVTDQEGTPQVGEFSLAVVDLAVLALADPNSQDIGDVFFGIQPLAVRLGFPLGVHAGRNVFVPGGLGGGGGAAIDAVREEFKDTGYWQADIETNENGEATVQFIVPDNLTTWQAEARGVTEYTEVGQGSGQVITTKELLVRPVTPRFLVAGDHLALAAVVHNNTARDLTVDVSLQSEGVQLDLPEFSTQEVEIPAGANSRVEWWGTVTDTDHADLLFTADAGELNDAVRPYQGPLPVFRYTAPVTYGTSGTLTEESSRLEIITLPRSYDSKAGSLEIELSPSLAALLLKALDALESSPAFSSDALISHFLPNVITYQTLQGLGVEFTDLENRLEILIPDTLDALAARQNEDGGWGWWEGGASDVEISSYILFGLVKAQQSGVFVEDQMIQSARGYLLATLPAVDMLTESWQYDQLALRYFALTEAGIDVSTGMVDLLPYRSQISPANQGLLATALEMKQPGNENTRTLLSDLMGSSIRTATGTHWENSETCQCWFYNTITTTAIVNYALARNGEFKDVLPEITRYLVASLKPSGSWGSPFETSWAILALNEVLRASDDLAAGFQYKAIVNGTELITGQAEGPTGLEAATATLPVETLYKDDPNALEINRSAGDGKLYYKAHMLIYRPAEDVDPISKGLSISRVYKGLSLEEMTFTQSGQTGDLIQVRLTLVVENDMQHLIIEDRIPSGAEVLDTRLNTTRQDLAEYLVSAPFENGWGWWYFNRPVVYDNRVIWAANYLPAGTYELVYLISLTHPGEYQVLPASARQQYFPETQAVSSGDKFTVEVKD